MAGARASATSAGGEVTDPATRRRRGVGHIGRRQRNDMIAGAESVRRGKEEEPLPSAPWRLELLKPANHRPRHSYCCSVQSTRERRPARPAVGAVLDDVGQLVSVGIRGHPRDGDAGSGERLAAIQCGDGLRRRS